jgi:uncharacterized membrane protein YfcA
MNAKDLLFVALTIFLVGYTYVFTNGIREARRRRAIDQGVGADGSVAPSPLQLVIGFVTNFFDTLGVGSFATTTAVYKLKNVVPVRLIPGTMNVGHTLPTILQAFIYTKIVPVDSQTLILMIAASVGGAWLGASIVARWPRRKIQIAMGVALLGAAMLLLMKAINESSHNWPLFAALDFLPKGGVALGLSGARLAIGMAGNFVLGMLMMIGIGLYAPCMILIYLLGMDPRAAFPIMMGSCAFLMPVSSISFVRNRSVHVRAALGLAIGGLPAVLLAAKLVTSLSIEYVLWLVVVVVIYTSLNMLLTANREEPVGAPAGGALQPEM